LVRPSSRALAEKAQACGPNPNGIAVGEQYRPLEALLVEVRAVRGAKVHQHVTAIVLEYLGASLRGAWITQLPSDVQAATEHRFGRSQADQASRLGPADDGEMRNRAFLYGS